MIAGIHADRHIDRQATLIATPTATSEPFPFSNHAYRHSVDVDVDYLLVLHVYFARCLYDFKASAIASTGRSQTPGIQHSCPHSHSVTQDDTVLSDTASYLVALTLTWCGGKRGNIDWYVTHHRTSCDTETLREVLSNRGLPQTTSWHAHYTN